MSEMYSTLSDSELMEFRNRYSIGDGYGVVLPDELDTIHDATEEKIGVYTTWARRSDYLWCDFFRGVDIDLRRLLK